MNRWLLVPVKPFAEAKSRLAGVLTPEERALVARSLLERTLALAVESKLFACLLVISRDPLVWEAARQAGACILPEKGEDLNSALLQARCYAEDAGVQCLMILPADLPLVTATDLHALCMLGEQDYGLVVGPSQDGGTNALHLHLPSELPFCFGEHSFDRHLEAASAAGLIPIVYVSPTLRFDLDTPADWEILVSVTQKVVQ